MIRTREHLAWHVAGHAYAATMCGFPVHKLSLDGFSEADLADRGDAVGDALPDVDGGEHLEGLREIAQPKILCRVPAETT